MRILWFLVTALQVTVKKGNNMEYNPIMTEGTPYTSKSGKQKQDKNNSTVRSKIESVTTVNTGQRYPKALIDFKPDSKKLHPTQKPVALLEYLIKTYTSKGALILDNCMGSGSTGVACKRLGRDFIGMELNEDYFKLAKERIEGTRVPLSVLGDG